MSEPLAVRPVCCDRCGSEHVTRALDHRTRQRCRCCGHLMPVPR